MSQQGDSQQSQEDDWWRQLYDDDAAAPEPVTPDSVDAHFDSALTAMSPPPPSPAADTLRLRRPIAPAPPPSWPQPSRRPVPRPSAPLDESAPGPDEQMGQTPAPRRAVEPAAEATAAPRTEPPSEPRPEVPPASAPDPVPPSPRSPQPPPPRAWDAWTALTTPSRTGDEPSAAPEPSASEPAAPEPAAPAEQAAEFPEAAQAGPGAEAEETAAPRQVAGPASSAEPRQAPEPPVWDAWSAPPAFPEPSSAGRGSAPADATSEATPDSAPAPDRTPPADDTPASPAPAGRGWDAWWQQAAPPAAQKWGPDPSGEASPDPASAPDLSADQDPDLSADQDPRRSADPDPSAGQDPSQDQDPSAAVPAPRSSKPYSPWGEAPVPAAKNAPVPGRPQPPGAAAPAPPASPPAPEARPADPAPAASDTVPAEDLPSREPVWPYSAQGGRPGGSSSGDGDRPDASSSDEAAPSPIPPAPAHPFSAWGEAPPTPALPAPPPEGSPGRGPVSPYPRRGDRPGGASSGEAAPSSGPQPPPPQPFSAWGQAPPAPAPAQPALPAPVPAPRTVPAPAPPDPPGPPEQDRAASSGPGGDDPSAAEAAALPSGAGEAPVQEPPLPDTEEGTSGSALRPPFSAWGEAPPAPAVEAGRPAAAEAAGTESAPPAGVWGDAPSGAGAPPAEGADHADGEPVGGLLQAPAAGEAWGETAFGEGGVRWAPDLPPGWVAAVDIESAEPEPGVVGGRPPTYAAEPTAWPQADPDGLDGLVPDTVLDGAQYGTLTLRTASVRGDSARYRGQPRRDALLTARFGSGDDALLLVAMASGARAADESHRAAQDTVRWIAGAVGRSRVRLAGDLRAARRGSLKSGLHRLTDRCYGRLRARGEDLGLDEGTYTASLRCLLLPADPECRIRLFFGVGDGGLFRIRGGAWQDLDLPPEETAAPFRFRASVARPGDALVMCSAGLAEPLRGEPALASHLADRWGGGRAPGLASYLADAQTRVKGYADDRTAVTVWDA